MLRFGTGGIPNSSKLHNVFSGIERINELKLGSMELEFVYQTWLKKDDAKKVKKLAREQDVILTSHGSYYINLNAKDKQKLHASIARIVGAAKICEIAGVKSLTFHPGFYLRDSKQKAYSNIQNSMQLLVDKLKEEGIKNLKITLETTGKESQFGTIQEIVDLSKEFDIIWPCVDFSHIYARSLGKINTEAKFQQILNQIKEALGNKAFQDLHMHMSGIAFGQKGEKNHLNLKESDFNYKAVLRVLKSNKVSGYITCESPNLEQDAVLMRDYYLSL